MGDGSPLPSFSGDPLLLPCLDEAQSLLEFYWDGLDSDNRVVGVVTETDFVRQFSIALDKALAVVRAAGGGPEDIGRLTVYVTDVGEYLQSRKPLGAAWKAAMGRHYPAIALVQVEALVDPRARVEIEATAVIPAPPA